MAEVTSFQAPADGIVVDNADPQLGTDSNAENVEVVETPEVSQDQAIDTDASRPDGLPEKYKTVADLAAAHASAERKITEMGQNGEVGEGIQGLFDMAGQDIISSGQISEATYEKLEAGGVTRELVNQHVAGVTSLAAGREAKVMEAFGGKADFDAFIEWAPKNLTNDEINGLNSMIESAYKGGAMAEMNMAVAGVMTRFKSGQDPRVVTGTTPAHSTGGPVPYASKMEAMKVIASEEYKTGDKLFQANHARRLALTPGMFT